MNAMMMHGSSPGYMLEGTMIPIPKNKRHSMNNSDNCRGICLQSALCKLLDLVILNKEAHKLMTSDLQFGFKSGLSTAMTTTVISETIDYYVKRSGMVYNLALDASKAFDRVEFSKLFPCLISRDVNPIMSVCYTACT